MNFEELLLKAKEGKGVANAVWNAEIVSTDDYSVECSSASEWLNVSESLCGFNGSLALAKVHDRAKVRKLLNDFQRLHLTIEDAVLLMFYFQNKATSSAVYKVLGQRFITPNLFWLWDVERTEEN